ncbi:hypothetical protein B5V02_09105 [Mesorhizobium kowhaii]|uniref:Uncharacterized protein n=1 Tax=Mesorhizobium kowhaii TaxID=1300272 RepID=A0A2W7C6L4_9HYPH|nr:hypothetical protein B5V02_09105 [Mesorhizobium kowhaii]
MRDDLAHQHQITVVVCHPLQKDLERVAETTVPHSRDASKQARSFKVFERSVQSYLTVSNYPDAIASLFSARQDAACRTVEMVLGIQRSDSRKSDDQGIWGGS